MPRGVTTGTDSRHQLLLALAEELARSIRRDVREVSPLEAVLVLRRAAERLEATYRTRRHRPRLGPRHEEAERLGRASEPCRVHLP